MLKQIFICLECKIATQATALPGQTAFYRCAECQEVLTALPTEFQMPEKDDAEGWDQLVEKIRAYLHQPEDHIVGEDREQLIGINQQMDALKQQPDSEQRSARLKKLDYEKKRLEEKYRARG